MQHQNDTKLDPSLSDAVLEDVHCSQTYHRLNHVDVGYVRGVLNRACADITQLDSTHLALCY